MLKIFHQKLLEVDSTNRYIRDEAARLWHLAGDADALIVSAIRQTAGRGQRGNSWMSASGKNLLFSILLRPSFLPVSRQFQLSQTIALAVKKTAEEYGVAAKLKWPNDIYVGGRKLAGILIETDYASRCIEQAIIGIGLNVNQIRFPRMERTPVSLRMLKGIELDCDEVLGVFCNRFSHYYSMLGHGSHSEIKQEYLDSLIGYKEQLHYADADGEFYAMVADVRECGLLVLKKSDGSVREYTFKEVELLPDVCSPS